MAGAQIRHLYPLCRNPRLLQDDLIGPPQIQPVLAAALIVKNLLRLSRLTVFPFSVQPSNSYPSLGAASRTIFSPYFTVLLSVAVPPSA